MPQASSSGISHSVIGTALVVGCCLHRPCHNPTHALMVDGSLHSNHVRRKILGGGEEGKREGMWRSQRRRSVFFCSLSWSWWYPSGCQAVCPSGASPSPPLLPIPRFSTTKMMMDCSQPAEMTFKLPHFLVVHRWGQGFIKSICFLLLLLLCVWKLLWQKIVFCKNIYPFKLPQKPKICILIYIYVFAFACGPMCGCICVCVWVCVLFIKGSLWS